MNLFAASDVVALDIETYSDVPITHGTPVYSTGAELLLFAWSVNGGPVKLWDPTLGEHMPPEVEAILRSDCLLLAHNAAFECWMLNTLLPNYPIDPNRWRCTMVRAFAHSLPGPLENLCDVLGVPQDKAKMKDAKALIHLFCKPLGKNRKLDRATHLTHPEEWQRFREYCIRDVEATVECARRMPRWNNTPEELALYQLDQRINRRGVAIDVDLIDAALDTIQAEQRRLSAQAQELTGIDDLSTTQVARVLAYLRDEHQIELPNLKAATVASLLRDGLEDLPDTVVMLLRNRAMTSKSSTAKYNAIKKCTSPDGMLRYLLQFCGAGRTARWSGRGPQFHNLPRPQRGHSAAAIEGCIAFMKASMAHLVYDDVMLWVSSAIRGTLVPRPGRKMVVSDLSNIEGRGGAWLAGEEWKIKAYRDYDAGTGPDLYLASYARSFGVSIEEANRQVGKVLELSMQYQGGVNAFLAFAAVYNLNMDKLVAELTGKLPPRLVNEAHSLYAWLTKNQKQPVGVSFDTWVACDVLKRLWREAHPAIVSYWAEIEDALAQALAMPGTPVPCRKVTMLFEHNWMRVILPSGRSLSYPSFEVHEGQMRYKGWQFGHWRWIYTFGGKTLENIDQAVSRDVLAHNMLPIEDAGYELLLTVHDEVITETPDTPEYTSEYLSEMLAATPPWAIGFPLAAAGHEMYRYAKQD